MDGLTALVLMPAILRVKRCIKHTKSQPAHGMNFLWMWVATLRERKLLADADTEAPGRVVFG